MIVRAHYPQGGYALELRAPDSLEGGLELHWVDPVEFADDPAWETRLWEELGLTRGGDEPAQHAPRRPGGGGRPLPRLWGGRHPRLHRAAVSGPPAL